MAGASRSGRTARTAPRAGTASLRTWTARTSERRAQRGFTLLEMLVVLVVVALAAGMLLPRLGDVGAARVDREAQRLAEAVTLLRERAILGGAPAALVVDMANGRWTAGDVDAAA